MIFMTFESQYATSY